MLSIKQAMKKTMELLTSSWHPGVAAGTAARLGEGSRLLRAAQEALDARPNLLALFHCASAGKGHVYNANHIVIIAMRKFRVRPRDSRVLLGVQYRCLTPPLSHSLYRIT